jgi:hypothetical protein
MIRLKKILLVTLTAVTLLILPACTLGQAAAEATPTAVDLNAVMTSAAATAFVQLTQIAAAATPTEIPPTEAPTQAQGQGPTNTAAPLVQVETLALASTATLAPGETPAAPVITLQPTFTLVAPVVTPIGALCKNSEWTGFETIPDGTVFKPWEKFVKTWKIRNTGTCTWDEGFSFRMYAGANMSGDNSYINAKNQFIAPGDAIDMSIKMYAPGEPGEYISHWKMFDDQGKAFGADVTVVIKVVK